MADRREGGPVIEVAMSDGAEPAVDRSAAEPGDEILARRLREADDTAAYDALVRRYHRRIWGLCYRMMGNRQEAEDMVQETFLRLHRFRDKYRDGGNFRAWLDRICVNVCLTQKDQGKRRVAVSHQEPMTLSPAAGSAEEARQNPEGRARITEILEQVERAMEGIPAVYRAALVLRAFGELTYPEIAAALGCSEGTVMSRINRARERLRERLRSLR